MRGVMAFVCVLAVGFAPVPFAKKQVKGKGAITLEELVGPWRDVELLSAVAGLPRPGGVSGVTFGQTTWTFGTATYEVRFDGSKSPAEFDLMRPGNATPYGRGVIRRDGERVVMAYVWSGERPTGFEKPTRGFVRTLERKR